MDIFAVTVHFVISLLFPVICSYLEMWLSPFVPPILLPNLPQGKKEGRGEQAAYGLESLGGNINLKSTIPKPQQPLYHFSVHLRNSLRKFCSLSELQMCNIDVLSLLQAILTSFSLVSVNKYWIYF